MVWSESLEQLGSPPAPLEGWLVKPFVLTETLKKCHPNITLKLIQQNQQDLLLEDSEYLQTPSSAGWVREVIIHNHEYPLTYGRVSMPINTYRAHQEALDTLETNPIGQTLLYNRSNVNRGSFSFSYLSDPHPLFIQVKKICAQNHFLDFKLVLNAQHFWARRSLFFWDGLPLSIVEIFFPTLPDYPIEP